ncbi:MAG: S41 family peptidase [Acidobacteriota bacterium]|nr:S41 family peptidase [Acidobacteriota bacterium]
MKQLAIIVGLVCFTAFGGENERMATFQQVWETIRDKHWDLTGTGVDWDKVYQTYKPKVAAADSNTELRKLLKEMLGELGQSHFGIIGSESSKALSELSTVFPGGRGVPGFELALVEDRVFIVKIDLESDAGRKGLGIGTEILEAEDKDAEWMVTRIKEAYKDNKNREMYQKQTLNELFGGSVGSKLSLKVRTDDKERDLDIKLGEPRAVPKQVFGLSMNYEYKSRVLDGNLGYISFNVFLADVGRDFQKDLSTHLKETEGLIIDLRGNPGGLAIMANNVAGRLVSETGKSLGSMTNQGGTMKFPVFPQPGNYKKPVALLIDGGSASTSEILAQGLQDLGRVRLFGTNSAGAALPSVVVDLPNGDQFQYAVADYVSTNGHHLEGIGVAPDEKTPHTLESMARGEDAALEAAKAWIKKKAGAKSESM